MRRICQGHKFPKFPKQADLFTSAHKYLCSLFFNFLAAGCSSTVLNPLLLISLSKIFQKTTEVLPWQTLAGLPWGTKALFGCANPHQNKDSTWIKSNQAFTTCTSARGSSPIRLLLLVPQWFLQLASWFMAVLVPFLLLQLRHSTASPRNCSKDQDSSNAGVARGGCNPTSSVPSPPWACELPSQDDHKGQHFWLSSLVSTTAFTSLIYPWESGLDWGGGEESLCYQNCKNMCRRHP